MKSRQSTLRGLQSIRTHSNRNESSFSPYKAFMKLTALEMEKVRRNKEKDSAMERLQELRTRFREIDAEKAVILKQLAAADYDLPVEGSKQIAKSVSATANNSFKLKY